MNKPDPFDDALKGLRAWDRDCRELHAKHMAEIRKLQEIIK